MRILFVCTPLQSHFHTLGPLARAFVERGHDVAFATGADFCERVRRFDFQAFPAGATEPELGAIAQSVMSKATTPGPLYAFPNLWGRELAPRMLPDLVECVRQWKPALIIHEPSALAAPLAAAIANVPSVNHSWGVRIPRAALERAAEVVAPLWQAHGVTPEPLCGVYRGSYIEICPSSLQPSDMQDLKTRYIMRPTPFDQPGNQTLPDWVATLPKRPTVHATLGTILTVGPLQTILTALRDEPINLILTVGAQGDPASLGAQPSNVHVEKYLPHTLLLPHCQAVISPAGAGTMLSAMAHGIPMLALPMVSDQFMNAENLVRSGAGRALMPPQVNEESVRREVRALLTEVSIANRAAAVRDEIRAMAAPAEIAAKLELTI